MQHVNKQVRTQDFRVVFKDMDDDALILAAEFGELLGVNRNGIYYRLSTGNLIEPVIKRSKQVRWRSGDVREYLRGLAVRPDHAPGKPKNQAIADAQSRRAGRPRKVLTSHAQAEPSPDATPIVAESLLAPLTPAQAVQTAQAFAATACDHLAPRADAQATFAAYGENQEE